MTALLDLLPGGGAIYALIGVLGGVLALWVGGRARERSGRQAGRLEAEKKGLQDAVETHERVAGADVSDGDADADRVWLRDRKPRGVLPRDGD